MIFVCKLPISKIKGYCFRYCLYQDHYLGSPDNGPDKDGIENKMPFILYIVCSTNDRRKRSRIICGRCRKGIHPVSLRNHLCRAEQ